MRAEYLQALYDVGVLRGDIRNLCLFSRGTSRSWSRRASVSGPPCGEPGVMAATRRACGMGAAAGKTPIAAAFSGRSSKASETKPRHRP